MKNEKKPRMRLNFVMHLNALVSGGSLESRFHGFGNGFFDEFDAAHRSIVTVADAEFDDAGITAGAIGIAFCDIIEEFVEDFVMKFGIFDIFAIDSALIEASGHEAAGMDVTAFREGDQFFDDAAKFFRFGFSRLNGFVIEKLCRERIEHSITMRGRTTEMTTRFTMSHSI